jgi:hypothetical protein
MITDAQGQIIGGKCPPWPEVTSTASPAVEGSRPLSADQDPPDDPRRLSAVAGTFTLLALGVSECFIQRSLFIADGGSIPCGTGWGPASTWYERD